MPKGKKKGKFEHRRTEQPYSSDEDAGIDMTIDNCSETSAQSDLKSNHDEAANRNDETVVSDSDDSEVEEDSYAHAYMTYLTLDSANLYEDEWDTENDSENYVEDEHVEVPHQGRPSHGRPKTKIDDDTLAQGTAMDGQESDIIDQENEVQEKLEEKVLELIDALSARAAAARASALTALRGALQRRPLAAVLSGHRVTLADHVTRAVRRGRDAERRAAAALAPILALQIGDEGTEEYMREVRPALVAAATDRAASLDTRTECCSSLAVLCYLLEEDMAEILDILRMYETIFSGSYLKGDGSVKVSGAVLEEGGWHAAALDGWSLLLGALDEGLVRAVLRDQPPGFARLADLLEACSLEVRMAAGGALAVAHERGAWEVEGMGGGAWGGAAELIVLERLQQLARDSHKYRAKRDRKLQRATFRDILKYFEEGEVPSLRVRVGAETLQCESWCARGAYGALAAALGAGLRALLPDSGPLRAALGLPDTAPLAAPVSRLNKLQRHLQNTAACKARTVARNKNRDKRSAALAL